ncbi:DUF192 domain-containing protein [Candidatus Micrarchaeota archaeon]|nr:DUF192 domain-containing protein [Candidatus Micrarchaeota archaeon]
MPQIRSVTRKRKLFGSYNVANTPLKRTIGIMFKFKVENPLLFILEEESIFRATIHSFFCFVRFDAIFLDKNKRIVDIHENIGPFRPIIAPKSPSKYFIECKAGEAKRLGIKIGEKLDW